MKWIVSSILWLAACGLGLLGLFANPPSPESSPSATRGEYEPSQCLTAVTIGITATPSNIALGQSSILSWSVEGADECAEVTVQLNGEAVATTGTRRVCPTRNATYTLVVKETRNGGLRQKSASAQVEVTSFPDHIVIDRNTCRPEQVLMRALANDSPNEEQTVELSCGVVIDLTGQSVEMARDHRSLIASPGCERGPRHPNDDVPLIVVKDKKPRIDALRNLFLIRGDHIRLSGFRLQGPTAGIGADDYLEHGIVVSPGDCEQPRPMTEENKFACAIHNIEFSNMEIFHWSGAGIGVSDNVNNQERGRLFNTFFVDRDHNNIVGAVHIKGNYFHDNRHDHGFGYGVVVGGGAYALIEQNVFNNNRHAIAGASKNPGGPPGPPENPDALKGLDYSGYTMRDNLILPEGGSHCNPSSCDAVIEGGLGASLLFPPLGILGVVGGAACHAFDLECFHTHQIDMHGDKNEWYSGSNWACGRAGETIIIERNTILYTGGFTLVDVLSDIGGSRGYAIKIRGDPFDKVVVDSNVFKHGSSGEAIAQNDNCHGKITHPIAQTNNTFGADPMKELGRCNFAGYGAGLEDAFMATGVTWWAWSPVTMQWRYLNTIRADRDFDHPLSELKLGDIDGDGVCDVAPKARDRHVPHGLFKVYSKSGTSPWLLIHPP